MYYKYRLTTFAVTIFTPLGQFLFASTMLSLFYKALVCRGVEALVAIPACTFDFSEQVYGANRILSYVSTRYTQGGLWYSTFLIEHT